MPRTARKRSTSGIYHVVLRGINKQTIFYDDEDREVFLNRLKKIKEEKPYKIYAYCLMGNHIHLLIKEEHENISKIMQKVLTSYIFWYNRKYERIGNLFQDRYKSEAIEDDSYLLCAARYIHQNPLKSGIVEKIEEYRWSSYKAYIDGENNFVDIELILSISGGKKGYINFMGEEEKKKFIDNENVPSISDEKLLILVEKIFIKYKVNNLLELEKEVRDKILIIIRKISGTSIRQISRITGVPVSIIRYVK